MKKKITFLFLYFSIFTFAQSGTIDTSFNPSGSGANNVIYSTAIQSDGKIIIGGDFTDYNGVTRNGIARLNTNGSLDITFNPGLGVQTTSTIPNAMTSLIVSIKLQTDGKIIILGNFQSYNGISRNRIARLNADGSLDTSFNPGTGPNSGFRLLIQSDGKIILYGRFTAYNGVARNNIARLNTNGSLDTSFNPTGAFQIVSATIQQDGKILILGRGTLFNEYSNSGDTKAQHIISRLNVDGSLDTSFSSDWYQYGIGDSYPYSILTQPDGKIIVIGNNYSGNFTRFTADGKTMNTSSSAIPIIIGSVYDVSFQSDGKIILGGDFTSRGYQKSITRWNADFKEDWDFQIGFGANNIVYSTLIQSDNKIVIAGSFTNCNGKVANRITRLNGDVPLSLTSFTPLVGCSGSTINITGTGFSGATQVSFGGTPAVSFTVISDTSISAVVGAGTSGNITVTKGWGSANLFGFVYSIGTPSSNTGAITGSATVCQGQNAMLYSVPAIANATSYQWTLPSGASGTSTTNSITVDYGLAAVSGNISVKGVNSCGAGVASVFAVNIINCSLPSNNFKLEVTDPTCQTKANGKLKITATAGYNYTAIMDGVNYTFTNNILDIANLAPKTYTICVKVPALNNYTQCFEFTVKSAPGLTAKTRMDTKGNKTTANVSIESGTAPYTVEINGKTIDVTFENQLNISVQNGDLLEIKTSIACEGKIRERVSLSNELVAYPNPTSNFVELFIPNTFQKKYVMIQMVDNGGKSVVNREFKVIDNSIIIPMENLSEGLYIINVQLETLQTVKIIKK